MFDVMPPAARRTPGSQGSGNRRYRQHGARTVVPCPQPGPAAVVAARSATVVPLARRGQWDAALLWGLRLVSGGPADDANQAEGGPHPVGSDVWAASLIRVIAERADRKAFAALFGWYAPRIKAFMIRGGTDGDVAQEVAQEAMIAVWRKAATFDVGLARPATWIFSIARNKRIDMLRRERRFDLAVEDVTPLAGEEPVAADAGAIAAETVARVRASVQTLPPDQLEVIRKAFFEEKSHSTIAAELGLPLGTVKSRIRHALLRLRQGMKGEGP
jgi:RNA polymerase sigma-70 factor, ECF subfamily